LPDQTSILREESDVFGGEEVHLLAIGTWLADAVDGIGANCAAGDRRGQYPPDDEQGSSYCPGGAPDRLRSAAKA
jgi:hypothetical protein